MTTPEDLLDYAIGSWEGGIAPARPIAVALQEAAADIKRLTGEKSYLSDEVIPALRQEIELLTRERDLALANADAVYAKLMPEGERLRAALNDAAYAIFQMKRMQPDAIREFASQAHAKACAVIDGVVEQNATENLTSSPP